MLDNFEYLSSFVDTDNISVTSKENVKITDNILSIYTTDFMDWFMVFNATFNNISVILWWSVLLVEETRVPRVPRENHRQTISHNFASSTPRHEGGSNSQL